MLRLLLSMLRLRARRSNKHRLRTEVEQDGTRAFLVSGLRSFGNIDLVGQIDLMGSIHYVFRGLPFLDVVCRLQNVCIAALGWI